jgi:hypothetical protein
MSTTSKKVLEIIRLKNPTNSPPIPSLPELPCQIPEADPNYDNGTRMLCSRINTYSNDQQMESCFKLATDQHFILGEVVLCVKTKMIKYDLSNKNFLSLTSFLAF